MSYSANQSASFVPRAVFWNHVKNCQSDFEMIIIQFLNTLSLEIINIQFLNTLSLEIIIIQFLNTLSLEIIIIQFPNTRALWITNTNDTRTNANVS